MVGNIMIKNRHFPLRSLTQRYLVALSLVALLSILGQVLIQTTLVHQSSDAHIINVAGRQRMLSQRLSKSALALQVATDEEQRQSRLEELQSVVKLWQKSQLGLQVGDTETDLPGNNSAEVIALFAEIEPQFEAMVEAAGCLIALYAGLTGACDTDREQLVSTILANEETFLIGMDRIVSQYDIEATARVDSLKRIELVLMSITLGVLLLEAFLIFRPVVRQLHETFSQLDTAQAELRQSHDQLELRVAERTRELHEANTLLTQEVAEREHAQQERERLIQELEDALIFKDQFLATMSHELRTPLNAVIGYAGIAAMEDDISDTVVHMLERIKTNSKRLLNLINDVLDISRINAKRAEIIERPIAITDMVKGWYEDFRQTMESKQIGFELIIDPTLPQTIIGDEERLTQIANNLLGNALKFTDQGNIRLSIESSVEEWKIVVSDTGIGIPEVSRHLIFDEFRQVDGTSRRKYGGAGLGLSIVKKLCILMGGSVAVSSILGEGSVFTVTLPLKTPVLVSQAS